jgi:hypothetical protein
MKTLLITSDMNLKDRNSAAYKMFNELEDNEAFKLIEEMTPEKLRDQMQSTLDIFQANDDTKIKVDSVRLDCERNLIVIEQIFEPQPENED